MAELIGADCACGTPLIVCPDCGDERCMRCDPVCGEADPTNVEVVTNG